MEIPHFNVVIATPGSYFNSAYLKSLLMTTQALNKEGLSWTFLNESGSFVSMARELTIGGPFTNDKSNNKPYGGQFTYDKIIWIDSDISWTPADFFKIFNSELDIVSGGYLMPDRKVPVYLEQKGQMMSEEEFCNHYEPFEIIASGFGFLAVKSGVFEKINKPWFGPEPVTYTNKDGKTESEYILIGEDLSWSLKATSAGFSIWADPNVLVLHHKEFPVPWVSMMRG